jgi:hypothetical protein
MPPPTAAPSKNSSDTDNDSSTIYPAVFGQRLNGSPAVIISPLGRIEEGAQMLTEALWHDIDETVSVIG